MFVIAQFQAQTNRKSVKKEVYAGYETREAAAAAIEKIKNKIYLQLMQKHGIVCPYEEKTEDDVINYTIKTGLMFDPDYYYKFYILEVA